MDFTKNANNCVNGTCAAAHVYWSLLDWLSLPHFEWQESKPIEAIKMNWNF